MKKTIFLFFAVFLLGFNAYALMIGNGPFIGRNGGFFGNTIANYYNPYIEFGAYRQNPQFNLECSPEVFTNDELNDLCNHWHRMIIATTTTNGYVLTEGLPVPSLQLSGGGSWALSGTDAAKFTIDANTGKITLSDAASVTVAGNLSITVTTPYGGTYDITVPVVDPTAKGTNSNGSYRFYDSDGTGTVYADDGGDPQDALNIMEQYSASTKNPATSYFKRGSVWPNARLDVMTSFPSSAVRRDLLDYGDPAQPRPKFIIDSAQTKDGAIDTYSTTTQLPFDSNIEGLEIDANNTSIRCIDAVNWSGLTINRIKCYNNKQDANSAGFYFNDTDNFTLRHCETSDIWGDGAYRVNTKTSEIGFCNFGEPQGSGADSYQSTNEGDTDLFNIDLWDHHNIGLIDPNTTGKGGTANEGNVRQLFEYNMNQADVFAGSMGDFDSTYRFNFYQGYNGMETNEATTLSGASQSAAALTYCCNTVYKGGRGYSISGFNAAAENWEGNEFNRADIKAFLNTGIDNTLCLHFDQPHTGIIKNNYCINAGTVLADNKGLADYSGNVTSITASGQNMTILLEKKPHFPPNTKFSIQNAVNPDNNVTDLRATYLEYDQILLVAPSGVTPVTESGGSITYTATTEYTTKTHEENQESSPSLREAPVLNTQPVLSGTFRELGTVDCSATVPSGYSADYFWHINGFVQDNLIGSSVQIPLRTEGIDPRKPDLIDINKSINWNDIGCSVEITDDETGYKNIYHAFTSDGHAAKRIENYVEGLNTPVFWVRPSELKTSASVSTVIDKFGGAYELTSSAQPSIIWDHYSDKKAFYFDGSELLQNDNEIANIFQNDNVPMVLHINFKADTTGADQTLVGFGYSGGTGPLIRLGIFSGNLQWIRRDGGGTTENITIATADTNENTLSIKDNGNTYSMWLNGTKVKDNVSWDAGIGAITSLDYFTLGALRRTTTQYYFQGSIENFVLMNSIQTDLQVENAHRNFMLDQYFLIDENSDNLIDENGYKVIIQ